jgi:hypothetical protein
MALLRTRRDPLAVAGVGLWGKTNAMARMGDFADLNKVALATMLMPKARRHESIASRS